MDSSNLLGLFGFLIFIIYEIAYKLYVRLFFCIVSGLDFVNKEGQWVPAPLALARVRKLRYVMSFFLLGVFIIALPGVCYVGYSSLGNLFCEDVGNTGSIIAVIIIEGSILFGVMLNSRTALSILTGKMRYVRFCGYYKISLSTFGPAVVLFLKSFVPMIGFNVLLSVLPYKMTVWGICWIIYGTMLLIEPFLFLKKQLLVFKNDVIIYSVFRKGSYLSKSDVEFRHETEAIYSLWVKGERKGQMPIVPQNLQLYRDLNLLEPNQEKVLSEG